MRPRLFVKRGELPRAAYQIVLFSGRPDRAGLIDIAGGSVEEFRGASHALAPRQLDSRRSRRGGCSDRQNDVPQPAFIPNVPQERLVGHAIACATQGEVCFSRTVAEKETGTVGIALVGGPDKTVGVGNVAMDRLCSKDGLAVKSRARGNQVIPRRTAG